jgi:uncharacterized protein
MNWEMSAAGMLVGVMVGATGVGGGSLMTPLLVLLFGVSPHTAIGTDLIYASLTKMFGVSVHSFQRRVDWQVFRRLALGSIPAAVATLAVLRMSGSQGLKEGTTLVVLGAVLLLTAIAMMVMPALLRRVGQKSAALPDGFAPIQPVLTVAAGAVLGLLVTLTSIGAGSLAVVVLLLLYPLRLTPARLVATDLAHAIPLALVAGAGHIVLGNVDFQLLGQLLLGSIPGVWLGAHFGGKLPDRVLRVAIALVLGAVGLKLVLG